MNLEWPITRLGDLLTVKHGYAFKGEYFQSHGDQLVLTPGNFRIGGGLQIRDGRERFYGGPYSDEFVLGAGDLLIAMTDLTQSSPILGSPLIVPAEGTYLHNQRLGKVVIHDLAQLDVYYAYYLFASDVVRRQLRGSATGSTVRHTSPQRVHSVTVRIPPLPAQRKIAAILCAQDDLIENNNLRIKILEEVAARVYQEWFVEFRYPGHAEAPSAPSELGPIPAGWVVSPLSSLAGITMGQSPPSTAYNTDGVGLPFHQGVGSYGPTFPTHNVFSTAGTRIAETGDILVSVRAPVGRINLADRRLILGRGLCAVRAGKARRGFLWQALKRFFREEDIIGGGSIFQSVTKHEMERVRLFWPGPALAGRFADIVEPIWDQVYMLTSQIANLRSTRDLLLPWLISGEVDVTDLDIALPSAA